MCIHFPTSCHFTFLQFIFTLFYCSAIRACAAITQTLSQFPCERYWAFLTKARIKPTNSGKRCQVQFCCCQHFLKKKKKKNQTARALLQNNIAKRSWWGKALTTAISFVSWSSTYINSSYKDHCSRTKFCIHQRAELASHCVQRSRLTSLQATIKGHVLTTEWHVGTLVPQRGIPQVHAKGY